MEKLVLASNGADADAVVAVERRHTELSRAAAMKTLHVLNMLHGTAPGAEILGARNDLIHWVRSRLQPYLRREAQYFLPALPHSAEAEEAVREAYARLHEVDEVAARLAASREEGGIGAEAAALRSRLGALFDWEQRRILPYLAFARQSIQELWELVNA